MMLFTLHRHLFNRLIKQYLLILLALFALFSIVDFTLNLQYVLSLQHLKFYHVLAYYLCQFSKRYLYLASISFLLTCLNLLLGLNKNSELIALQSLGIPLKKALRPFLYFSLGIVATTFLNHEICSPYCQEKLSSFQDLHIKPSTLPAIVAHDLTNGSKWIYSRKHSSKLENQDVYWIRSLDDFWHFKKVDLSQTPHIAHYADHFTRNEDGSIEKAQSFDYLELKDLHLEEKKLDKNANYYAHSFSMQIKDLFFPLKSMRSHNKAWVSFLDKLFAPSCIVSIYFLLFSLSCRFKRGLMDLLLYAGVLSGLLAFFMIYEAVKIMGSGSLLHPFWAAAGLPILLFGSSYFVYQKS